MNTKRTFILLLALCCTLSAGIGVLALEVDSDTTLCLSAADFAEDQLSGICITGLPDYNAGTVMLGTRVVRSGDILTAQQLSQLTFQPLRTETDTAVTVTYLPIYEDRVAPSATMTISIRGKENKAPIAEDMAMETYKNLPLSGTLKTQDPEGSALTYSVTRNPKRGDVTINADGSFVYTPKKNKIGVDSFTYTATDAGGMVSREATVTIQILKPGDMPQYADTAGESCRFAAEWMKNTGLFVGETINGKPCFQPEKLVTRGEFVAMLVQSLGIPVDEDATYTGFTDDVPTWLKPYLAAALRSGLTAGWQNGTTFDADGAITGKEAALLLQNALDLPHSAAMVAPGEESWMAETMAVMASHGIELSDNEMNRSQVAQVLYQASILAPTAPGLTVFLHQ